MITKLDKYWDIVADAIKDRVKTDSSAEIYDVLETLFKNGTINFASTSTDNYTERDIEIIDGKVTQSSEYISQRKMGAIYFKRNPSYEFEQSTITTNTSIQLLNTALRRTNRWTVIIAAITGTFITLTFFKNDKKDIQVLNSKLERQEQILDSMLHHEIGKDSELHKALRDTALTLRSVK